MGCKLTISNLQVFFREKKKGRGFGGITHAVTKNVIEMITIR